jgi:tetratricopeptide (TPR) repeat protein
VTPILLALAAAAAPAPAPQASQLAGCLKLARRDPEAAIARAQTWRQARGGIEAGHCLGAAHAAAGRWPSAAAAFEEAARAADAKKDSDAPNLWTQAGNAWLANGDHAKARAAFDTVLASTSLPAPLRGEVHLDRARAAAPLGDLVSARADTDKGLELVPDDPFGWYLSAAIARRQGDLARARKDIGKAVELAPGEAALLLEAGNIAGLSGDLDAARAFFARAVRAAPESDAGRAAQAALAANAPAPAPAPAPQAK